MTRVALLRAPEASATRVPTLSPAVAPLVLITAAGAALRLWSFGLVATNPFYDAAVRSMTLSWHNLFFGAFEPGAQVSVDKIPVDLALQVASVELFGFNSIALRVPEVAAGILAIPLLYDLVRRLFGRTAGLSAAAALAVLPAAILTAHSDTMDSVMMLLDVLAAWLVVVGAQSRRVWPVVAAGAALGLAFNVKLFEALLVAPALAVLMLIAVDRRRLLAIGGSLAAFCAVGLAWIVAASQTPLGRRPWPIGSTDGSIWNVIFVFNGLDRVRTPASARALALDPPGWLRLLHAGGQHYARTVGTLLVAALLLGAAGGATALVRHRPLGRLQVAGAAFLAVWLALGAAMLSHMQRMEPRYLEAITPAIAAVAGAGLAGLLGAARARSLPAAAVLLAVALAGALVAHPPAWAIAGALAGAVGCGVVAATRGPPAAVVALGLLAVLAVPAAGALAVAREHQSDAGLPVRAPAALSAFLVAHQGRARYEVVSPTVARSAPLIMRDARPVLMLTSLHGRPLLRPGQLRHLVATGEVRYMLGRGACGSTHCPAVVRWARRHARDVSARAGLPEGSVTELRAR